MNRININKDIDQFIYDKCLLLKINIKHLTIIKSKDYDVYCKIKYDRGKEKRLNDIIKTYQVSNILDTKVKEYHVNWSKFNKINKKNTRNKTQIVNKFVNLNNILKDFKLKLEIKEL